MPDAHAKPKRRWWVRLLRMAVMLGMVGILAASGALWWVYSKRVALLNNALAEAGPLRGTVGTFEVTRSGGVELTDLVFTDRATGAVVARLPRVSGQANLSKLPPDEIRSFHVKDAQITLNAAMLENWRKQAGPGSVAPGVGTQAIPIPFGIRFSKLHIEDAHVRLEQAGGTSVEVTLNYRGEDISVRPGGLSTGEQELSIEHGEVKKADGGAAPFDVEKLRVKGKVESGIVELTEVDLEKPDLRLTPELLAAFGVRLGDATRDSATAPGAAAPPTGTTRSSKAPTLVHAVRIGKVRLNEATLSAAGFTEGNASGLQLPDVNARLTYEAEGVDWHEGAAPVVTAQVLHLDGVRVEAPGDSGHVRFETGAIKLGTEGASAPWVVESLMLAKPDILWTPELRKLLTFGGNRSGAAQSTKKGGDATAEANTPRSESADQGFAVLLKQGAVTDAQISIADPEMMAFELHTKGALMLANLRMDGDGFHSQSFQTLEVTEGRLEFPSAEGQPAKKPWLELPHGEAIVKPDDWNERTRLARLALDRIVVRMRDGNTPWDSGKAPVTVQQPETTKTPEEKAVAAVEAPPGADSEKPWWERINCGQLSVKEGRIDLVLDVPKPVDMQARVDIATQRTANGGSQHTVKVAEFTGRLPTLSPTPFPVMQAAMLEGVLRLPEMWSERKFDELHLSGASVDLSEPLLKLFEPDKSAAEAVTITKDKIQNTIPSEESPWEVGLLGVKDSSVTITNLVPGMPAVKFGVSLEVKDTPLLAEDIARNVAPQRVELHDLKIPSPNGTARYVAELDSIFVRFTLGGLMRKEIDGIEIVSPTLFVGEDLFWYVDFYRKYAERGSKPAPQGPHVAANEKELEQKLAAEVAEAEPTTSQASWSVKRLQVHSGKLMLAPKGVPLKGFKTPFPFQIDSEVTRGTLNADMQIPSDVYELPDLNLQFVGMSGKVQFNLPLKQKDNNLVETFEVDSIRWKEIRTGKAFLSVTYDSAGIYSKFGADAYEGYLKGEVNVYTDDSFHWDGWVTGTDVQLRDLTRILCPGYVTIDGSVETTLVAQGSRDELYQADGTFKNRTPGVFTITGLNDLIQDLPKDWDPLKAQITKIGLETLRDFKYDHAEMKGRFYGREGNGVIRFSGPTGSRNFDINVYDHRWRTDDGTRVSVSSGGQ